MSASIDIAISTAWIDVNTVTSIAVGTAMSALHKEGEECFIQEGATTPPTLTEGMLITKTAKDYAAPIIASGSLRVWVRCKSPLGAVVAFQES